PSLRPPPEPEQQEEERPKPTLAPGDLTLAKMEPKPQPDPGESERRKPRTIKEALARREQPPGRKMKQDGGVQRHSLVPSMDTRGTPFGEYDARLVEAVSSYWYDILDEKNFASDARGHVTLEFNLNYKGQITDMKVIENTVSETLSLACQRAVLGPQPYGEW